MDCPEMEEIVIVWNNKLSPKKVGLKQMSYWKRPVHFCWNPHNSMELRFSLPPKSKAKVFFSIDDDILTTCAQLKVSFAEWKKNAVGDVGPLVGFTQRSFDFSSGSETFFARKDRDVRFYQIMLVGVAWISRHYLELYNANRAWEIQEIRKVIGKVNNCDDIGMNFLAKYFYGEFHTPHKEEFIMMVPRLTQRQFQKKNFVGQRSECIRSFIEILGFNPLQIIDRKGQAANEEKRFVNPLNKRIIYEKRKMYQKLLVEGKPFNDALFGNCDQCIGALSTQN